MNIRKPPGLADKLLSWFCKPELLEEIQGDLHAYFQRTCKQDRSWKSSIRYWFQVFHFIRPFALKKSRITNSTPHSMFKNHFKIAIRTSWRHKGYASINVFGLAIGMACCMVILLYVHYELTFDRFHADADRIHRIVLNETRPDGSVALLANTPGALQEAVEKEIPEVEYATRLHAAFWGKILLSNDEYKYYDEDMLFVDRSFFNVFTFEFIQGNPLTAFEDPTSVVLTESLAQKFFGDSDALGETLTFRQLTWNKPLKVTGIVRDVPSNSHLQFDFLLSTLMVRPRWADNWGSDRHMRTYLKVHPGTSIATLDVKIQDLMDRYEKKFSEKVKHAYFTQPLTGMDGIHLGVPREELVPGGNKLYIKVLLIIAAFIIAVAGINYVNLATARAATRAKEIGVRKVVGAFRKTLIYQFITESILISFLAAILAIGFTWSILPFFNNLMQKNLSLLAIDNLMWVFVAAIALLLGIAAGLYPALYLSSFKPVSVFSKKLTTKKAGFDLRKVLVISQFSLSVFLIVGMIVMHQQMKLIRSADLGFDKDQVVLIKNFQLTPNRDRNFVVRQELEKLHGVIKVSGFLDNPIGMKGASRGGMQLKGSNQEPVPSLAQLVDHNYLDVLGLELVEGHNFSKEFRSELNNSVIVNEAAVKQLGIEGSAIGQKLDAPWDNSDYTIIGVVKDFHASTLHHEIIPFRFSYIDQAWQLAIKISGGEIPETLVQIEETWSKFVPHAPLDYYFLDDAINNLYIAEQNFHTLFSVMTGLALIITCLGLLGLVAFMTERRTKEIGIRKVLGASIATLIALLSKEFFILVGLANLIAWPIAYLIMKEWLENFAYRIDIDWSIFFMSGMVAAMVALLTMSFHTYKTAVSNPVDSLRDG